MYIISCIFKNVTSLVGLNLFFSTALTTIQSHQLALAAIKLLILAQLPFVMVIQAQSFAFVLIRQLGFFEGQYVSH